MARMKSYNQRNAPEEVRPILKMIKDGLGGIPGLVTVTAASPLVLQALTDMTRRFQRSSLEPEETELVIVAACREYGNEYAFEMQSYMAGEAGLPEHVIEALHKQRPEDKPWQDERYNALWAFIAAVVAGGGKVGDADIKAFRKAGFNDAQMLEVVFGINIAHLICHLSELAELSPDRKFRWSGSGLFSRGRK